MSAKVILTITAGDLQGKEYIFAERTTCIIGRSEDCQLQMPSSEKHRSISRYHCLLDINPPNIRVRDFGSKNGTYINGQRIGQDQTPEVDEPKSFAELDLKAGDEIKVGDAVFKVSIDPETWSEISPSLQVAAVDKGTDSTNSLRKGNLEEKIQDLLDRAREGKNPELLSIRGYKVIRKLGVGCDSEVYLLEREETGDRVALKVMLPQIATSQGNIIEFIRAAANAKALNHPHIVQLKDYGNSDGIFFLTQEYCENGSLADLMQRRGGRLSAEEAVSIIVQVLAGLEAAHNTKIDRVKGRGLIHGDLKPSNILLSNNNNIAKIADYGLSKAFDLAGLRGLSVTSTHAAMPYFLPRQQIIDFKHASPAADVWAAAAVLYYAITGTYPRDFTGQDPWLTLLQTHAVPILRRDPSLRVPLAQAIDLALIDRPQIHFSSAAQFQQLLSQAIMV